MRINLIDSLMGRRKRMQRVMMMKRIGYSGLVIGGVLGGLGYLLSRNDNLRNNISTKAKDSLHLINDKSHLLQERLVGIVGQTKTNFMDMVGKGSNSNSGTGHSKSDKESSTKE